MSLYLVYASIMFDSFFGAVGFVGGVFGLSVIVPEQGWRREAPAKELTFLTNMQLIEQNFTLCIASQHWSPHSHCRCELNETGF